MAALGIPTTRALCVVGSPLPVRRERIETAAVVTRVAESFVRFGHFEHFAHHGQPERLAQLVDFVVEHFYPECAGAPRPALALLGQVARRTASLMADWQSVGFCHGVMNTDNMSVLGLTIDYGPFGFLDVFDPGHVCNHSDTQGRYAWARQPAVALWNLHALAHALLPLLDDPDAALAEIEAYKTAFADAMRARWRAKLGLRTAEDDDAGLIDALLRRMAADRCDFTIAWRRLCGFDSALGAANAPIRDLFIDRAAFDAWAAQYAQRLAREGSVDAERAARMRAVNPRFVLRNHLAETAIRAAEGGDFAEVERLGRLLRRPYDDVPDGIAPREADAYAGFPPDWAQTIEVSCSS
jgi:uncharacterized protein YdiU (UPF0061 family)